ncbi:MAG: riboflavin biosynthesis protein RibF [Planctomycetales bacterium]|nr:riboflavin biosynthesis protein RibF [Planctomycetales bacterium]MCA9179839.1 riboflavin biosynthesis protein RibF [Planctomycetales bacterium]
MAILLHSTSDFPSTYCGGAVSIGNFDGVHRGHAVLLRELVALSRSHGGPAIVVTFDPPPTAVLHPDRPQVPPLTTMEHRAQLLGRLGVDVVLALPTDQRLLALSPHDFFHETIVGILSANSMCEGPNFRFGHQRAGDTSHLGRLCSQQGIELRIVQPELEAGGMISSTRIRQHLLDGQVQAANSLLTMPYEIGGIVSRGQQRGRELGFPTANLTQCKNLLPAHGVYSGRVSLDGKTFAAAVSIGPNPTFAEDTDKVEIHLVNWSGSLYGQALQCQLDNRIRSLIQFESIAELRAQIERDVNQCASHTRRILDGMRGVRQQND